MVSSLERRVAALEESASGGGNKCPECGWGGGDGDHLTYELIWVDPGRAEDREEFCETCGQQLVYVITWGDEA